MSSEVQIQVLEQIAAQAARNIHEVIAVQDIDEKTARALSAIAASLQGSKSYAEDYAHRWSSPPVHASERDNPHGLLPV